MPNETPAVVEKQLVDINLATGMDESKMEESIDWTAGLVLAQNVVVTGGGVTTRPGIYNLTALSSPTRLGNMANGLCAVAATGATTAHPQALYQMDEGASSFGMNMKGLLPNLTVDSRVVGSCPGGPGVLTGVLGVANLTYYQAIMHSSPAYVTANGNAIYVSIINRASGNVVASYKLIVSTCTYVMGAMVGVDDRYLHIYLSSDAASGITPRMTVIDTQAYPGTGQTYSNFTFTALTGTSAGDRIAGVVAISGGSVAFTRGATCRYEKFNNSRASTANGTIASINCTGVCTDGTTYYLSGNSGAGGTYLYLEVSVAFATTRTVAGPTFPAGGAGEIRVCTSAENGGTGGITYLIAYVKEVDQNAGEFACPVVYRVLTGETAFTTIGYLPNWTEASLPTFCNGVPMVHMHNVMRGVVDGITDDILANCSGVINLEGYDSTMNDTYPRTFRVEAVLDEYVSGNGYPNASATYLAAGSAFFNLGVPYRPAVTQASVAGYLKDVVFAHWNKASVNVEAALSFSLDTCTHTSLSPQKVKMDTNAISGGLCMHYDGDRPTEYGFVSAPSMTVKADASGGTIPAGLYSWVCIFSYKDRSGLTHYSRTSRPTSVTSGATGRFTIQVVTPTVTCRRDKVQVSIYRTAIAPGTQYNLVYQGPVVTAVGTATVPDNEVYLTYTDSTTDAVRATGAALFRQPGTIGTNLDRYHALAGDYIIRHKDRVYYCKGNKVYFSGQAIDGEAPWFNPAFSFDVSGGTGPIVGMSTMDGTLLVFKGDAVFAVDGDGPPDNGGNGTDFSPPKKLHTEYGCVDSRYIVNTPMGVCYRSSRGIELINRKFQVEAFFGQRVAATTERWPIGPYIQSTGVKSSTIHGGAAFDRQYGRIYFMAYSMDSVAQCAVYDMANNAWTLNTYTGNMKDVCFASSNNVGRIKGDWMYMTDGASVFVERSGASGSGLDYYSSETHVPWSLETGWIKAGSIADRIRVTDLIVSAAWKTNHNLKVSVYYNYDKTTATVIATKTADQTALAPAAEQMVFQPAKENVQSMKFLIQTLTPTVSTALSTGLQMDLYGLSVRLGIKGGGAKLPSAQKG